MDGYKELASAIVERAAMDYHSAVAELIRNPRSDEAKSVKRELVRFFHSEWFAMLSDTDGERLMRKIDEMVKGDTYDSD